MRLADNTFDIIMDLNTDGGNFFLYGHIFLCVVSCNLHALNTDTLNTEHCGGGGIYYPGLD